MNEYKEKFPFNLRVDLGNESATRDTSPFLSLIGRCTGMKRDM